MKSGDECCQETLAKGRTAHVQRCVHCQSLSVHVGPVTLRFAPEAAESLWNTLGEALFVLHAERKEEAPFSLANIRSQGSA